MPETHPEWLELEHYTDIPLFNTKAVVQQTGIAAPTLRAWERRYMILSPERARNDYRLYSERDIAIIRWLKAHVDSGMSISQAVALFHHLEGEHTKATRLVASQPLRDVPGDAEQSPTASYNMQLVQERLLTAFTELDEATAIQLMAGLLAVHPIEQICTDLVTPTLWEIGRRWEQGLITVSIEHFASVFFHGLLTNLLHATPVSNAKPLVITCCAPGEGHELAPLMLSLLLRRAGLRVAYLGQSIEIAGLLKTAVQLSPALICVSATLTAYQDAVLDLGQQLSELPPPRPIFIFGGQAFERHPDDLPTRLSGVHMQGDLQSITAQIKQIALQQA